MSKIVAASIAVAIAASASTTGFAQQDRPVPQDELTLRGSDDYRIAAADRIKGESAGYWIVTLDDAPLATYTGGVAGLTATSPSVTGAAAVDVDGVPERAYLAFLSARHEQVVAAMTDGLGRSLDVVYRYTNAINGLSVWLTPDEASRVLRLSGVADIERSRRTELATDLGPGLIGAPAVWDGSATGVATQGEGVVIGVLDSGINPSNAAFAGTGSDGYTHVNPLPGGGFLGACDPGDAGQFQPEFTCNSKLVGAYDFFEDDDATGVDSFDHDGHGSHTASTAAGNVTGGAGPNGETISGVAPHANIISYRICGDATLGQGFCNTDGTVAAVDQAIADGVDVINYSIGSSTPVDPWSSADTLAFLNARTAGVFVSISTGNDGPGGATVGSPAPPWAATVAALTHDRPSLNSLVGMAGGSTPPPDDMRGRSNTVEPYTGPVVNAADLPQYILDRGVENNALCAVGDPDDGVAQSPWPPGTFEGAIVVCDRGRYARIEKSENVAAAGAGGFIHADSGAGENADFHVVPGIHIDREEGALVKDWVSAWNGTDPQPTATITAAIPDPDAMAGFSSRGPNRSTGGDTLAPTIGAPGVAIWAAHGKYDEDTYTYLSGTSMAAPHVAGSAALLTALHPGWTPAQIQSALETTAETGVHEEDGITRADPFDVGSGRVRVDVAAAAALVLDETQQGYLDADPDTGGDPTTINHGHLATGACLLRCAFVRTVTSTASVPVTWTVRVDFAGPVGVIPDSFVLTPGASQDVEFVVDVTDLGSGAHEFGRVVLTPDTAVPAAHFPMAIRPQTGDLPGRIDLETRRDAGSDLVRGLTAIGITDLVAGVDGLVEADLKTVELPMDPTNGDPYDDQDGIDVSLVDVAPGATRAVFEITESASPDVDLFVGLDTNGDGHASADELVALSASGAALERVVLDTPDAGTWWVLVQNWQASTDAPDAITLATAVLDGSDSGNARVEGPVRQSPLQPFDIRVHWDVETAEPGEIFYGWVTLGTDPGHQGNIGSIPLTLTRLADDVAKAASTDRADRGETIDYEITVAPNVLSEDLAYHVTDDLPDGLTYVEGSASASAGDVAVADGVLTWTGVMPTSFGTEGSYTAFTNLEQPEVCALPISGGYLDLLSASGGAITPQPGIEGDTVAFTAFATSAPPTEFYGDATEGITFTDDGFAFFDSTPGPAPFFPTPIGAPTWYSGEPEAPNDLMAPFWADMEIFADPAAGRGVSLATLGDPVVATVIEFDDLEPWSLEIGPVPGAPTVDFEIFNWHTIDDSPGRWEFAFAYDDVGVASFPATGWPYDLAIGVENGAGDAGTEIFAGLFADEPPVSDDLVICFDYERPRFPPVSITFRATVDDDVAHPVLVNAAVSVVDHPGSAPEVATASVAVPPITSRDRIQDVRDQVDERLDEMPWYDRWLLERAVESLDRALDDRNWIDGDTLEPAAGRQVFRELTRAADLIRDADRRAPGDLVEWNIELRFSASDLATAAVVEAGSPPLASLVLAIADGVGDHVLAIALYGAAWNFATEGR